MKSAVADYRYRVICLRIAPIYGAGTEVRLTEYPRALTMAGGQVYRSDSGYQFTGLTTGSTSAAAVVDLDGILAAAGIARADVASGVYDNARWSLFATTFTAPTEDEEPLCRGVLGKTTIRDDRYASEMMALVDVLNQAVGATYSATCPSAFGGTEAGGCQKPLGPLTVTGTLTSVTSARAFVDSARGEAADYFSVGLVEFTSGANAGLKAQEIQAHASGGAFTLFESFPYVPAVGDAYSLVPGCRKRLVDCQAWGNVARRWAFDFVPAGSVYAKVGSGA